jgi:uncharacterized membrane protein HdeD (DUF308 family)
MAASTASGRRSAASEKARRDELSHILADSWWSVGLRGLAAFLFGLICLINPGLALTVFVYVFAAYMLVDGVFALFAGIKAARSGERWYLLILQGLVSLAAAVVAISLPVVTLVALTWLVAIWAIVSGVLMLGAAFTLNLEHGRWWLALGGIASLIFGILLVLQPLIGAVVLILWLGAFGLVMGIFLLILAFQLHGKKEDKGRKAPAAKRA